MQWVLPELLNIMAKKQLQLADKGNHQLVKGMFMKHLMAPTKKNYLLFLLFRIMDMEFLFLKKIRLHNEK